MKISFEFVHIFVTSRDISNPANLLTIYRYVPFPIPVLPRHSFKSFNEIDTIQDIFDLQNPARGTNLPITPIEGIHFTTKLLLTIFCLLVHRQVKLSSLK